MKPAALGLALLLASCDRAAEVPEQPDAAPAPAATATPAPLTLEGYWRVAGIDGAPLDGDIGIALQADAKEIWWEPRCAGVVVAYRIAGNTLTHPDPAPAETAEPAGSDGPPPPAPVCAIALPPRLVDVANALRAATRVERTPANGVLLSGGTHSLLLFSQ